jgi:hypothetical protein
MNDVDIDGGRLTARNADVGLHSGQILRLPMSTESQLREKLRKIEALFAGCSPAWGPDADRRAKLLIYLTVEGSFLDAYSHLASVT